MDGIEVLGEVIIGGIEMGAEKNPKGCLITIVLISILLGVCFYFYEPSQEINGIITKKLPEDRVLVKTKNGEDVYTISHELYLNKKTNDSIKFTK